MKTSTNNKNHLQNLLDEIKVKHENNETIEFEIIEARAKGFTVKVNNLFAFVSYHHMPWCYNNIEYWTNVSKYLIGQRFLCDIHQLKENPLSIVIDAKKQQFSDICLEESKKYKGIVLFKAQYGLFIDIGFHFNWQYGSIVGLAHKSTFINETDFDNSQNGSVIETIFRGYTKQEQVVFGEKEVITDMTTVKLDKYIGTVQKVKVVDIETKQFLFMDKYPVHIPFSRSYYSENIDAYREYFYSLKNGQLIECELIKINKKHDNIIAKLIDTKSV